MKLVTPSGMEYTLSGAETRIGRGAGNDIVLDDVRVSGNHAVVRRTGTTYVLEDLNSTNGTYVNGKLLEAPYTLQDRDTIEVGDSTLTFVAAEQAAATVVDMRTSGKQMPPDETEAMAPVGDAGWQEAPPVSSAPPPPASPAPVSSAPASSGPVSSVPQFAEAPATEGKDRQMLAIGGLVAGVLSVLAILPSIFLPFVAVCWGILALVGVVLSAISLRTSRGKGFAIGGLVVSGLSFLAVLCFGLIAVLGALSLLNVNY